MESFDWQKEDYEFKRGMIKDRVSELVASRERTKDEVLNTLMVRDPYDTRQESAYINLTGLRAHRAARVIDVMCHVFEGDPDVWEKLTGSKTVDLGGGHGGDLHNRYTNNQIRPIYPILSSMLYSVGSEIVNVDMGPKPRELPSDFDHLQIDLINSLLESDQSIDGINKGEIDVVTCLNFCTIGHPSPFLLSQISQMGYMIDDVYLSVIKYATDILKPGGLLIVDGKRPGEVWWKTDEGGLDQLENTNVY